MPVGALNVSEILSMHLKVCKSCRLEGICDKLHSDSAVCVPRVLRWSWVCCGESFWHVAVRS